MINTFTFLQPCFKAKYGGGKSVLALSLIMLHKMPDWSHKEVYFENWFSSMSLLQVFKRESILAAGTIWANCSGKDFKISKRNI